MRRGTTPTHIFTLPFDASLVTDVRVLYSQGGKIYIRKCMEDCSLSGNKVTLKLTREETMSLQGNSFLSIQIEVWVNNEEAFVSEIIMTSVSECLDSEV